MSRAARGQSYDRGIEDQPPYWKDWAHVLRFAFAGSNGSVIAVMAMLSALLPLPVIGIFVMLFLLLAIPKHGLEVLRDSAHGHRVPPAFGFDVGDRAVFSLLAVLLIFAVIHLALSMFVGSGWAAGWRLVMAMAIPLVAMSLAIDEDLGRAINPVYWVTVLWRIGPAYLGAAALIWIGLSVGIVGAAWLDRILPPFFGAMMSTGVAAWAIFTAAHIGGRLIFQYRDVLGFEATGPEQPERLRVSRDHRLEDQITALIASGKVDVARPLLEAEIKERAVSAVLHKQYRALLHPIKDREALLAHGRQWLHQRVFQDESRAALSLLQECLDLDPKLSLLDPAAWPPLIAAAENAGLPRLAEAARAAQSAALPGTQDPA